MEDLQRFSVEDIKGILIAFRDALSTHSELLNALNVYPVPDGDTGTNMSLTLQSVIQEIEDTSVDAPSQWKAISHGSLMGARGNSGVILSQILRSIADTFSSCEEIDTVAIAQALTRASDAAYASVLRPVEGTILTVAREVAELASEIVDESSDLVTFLEKVAEEGRLSLQRTPDLLPVLKEAGVVDAGGAGYLLLLSSFLHVANGRPIPVPAEAPVNAANAAEVPKRQINNDSTDVGELRYEVMFFLATLDEEIDVFKQEWAAIGDSIVVVGGDGLYNCHIHTNDIGAAIEAGIRSGKPNTIRVTDLQEEVEHREEMLEIGGATKVMMASEQGGLTAVVAVVAGEGVSAVFESLGVHAVVSGGQSMNPSVRDLIQAVEAIGAEEIIILPNNKNIIPVSEQVDSQVDKRVVVVPTRSIPEGIASFIAFDPRADAQSNLSSMSEAAQEVTTGEVTRAVRDSETQAGKVEEGDWIGLSQSAVLSISESMTQAAINLLATLINSDHELVSIISGKGSNKESIREISEWLEEEKPYVAVEVHAGGQPLYPYYFGVE